MLNMQRPFIFVAALGLAAACQSEQPRDQRNPVASEAEAKCYPEQSDAPKDIVEVPGTGETIVFDPQPGACQYNLAIRASDGTLQNVFAEAGSYYAAVAVPVADQLVLVYSKPDLGPWTDVGDGTGTLRADIYGITIEGVVRDSGGVWGGAQPLVDLGNAAAWPVRLVADELGNVKLQYLHDSLFNHFYLSAQNRPVEDGLYEVPLVVDGSGTVYAGSGATFVRGYDTEGPVGF